MFIRFIHHSHPVMLFSVILFVSLFTLDVSATVVANEYSFYLNKSNMTVHYF